MNLQKARGAETTHKKEIFSLSPAELQFVEARVGELVKKALEREIRLRSID